ncbi:ATP-binding protein [Actinoplanes sp. KI2]|uniref:ATP-binding protein n=1 Tax=Actinoplanes sp. KI2 TaxID=2983315 RepID=UPI0021D58DB3|nr:ATP-binding protein [Actinoplanes sp. KI2]MCU7728716.1 ATP-binding protein [Actinoplanes sp. KI2]
MDVLRLSFTDAVEIASIRGRAVEVLRGQPVEVVDDVMVVITELVANVVQHTDRGGHLNLTPGKGVVQVEVHDHSRSFPQLQRSDPRRPGGRGLLLVAALAQAWGSRPTATGKVVWAWVAVLAEPSPTPSGG